MKILIVYAHPEPRSLNGSLKNLAVSVLERAGHGVVVSGLYAMGWKPQIDAADFPSMAPGERLIVQQESKRAFTDGTQSTDIAAEQDKLRWADTVLFQFPLWWFSMPAILKGWIERVYAYGLAYGVGEHSERHWGDRYGEGMFVDKRAMLIVTAGGWAEHYSERGVNGPIDDLLFPIQHGILYYPGFDVLPPFVAYRSDSIDEVRYAAAARALEARLLALDTTQPIAYRKQNGGDYDIPACTLKPGLEADGDRGLRLHTHPRGATHRTSVRSPSKVA
jgi:NAD(P)H dehydrogenase (quinone)